MRKGFDVFSEWYQAGATVPRPCAELEEFTVTFTVKPSLCLLLLLLWIVQCVLLESLQICHLHLDSSLLALVLSCFFFFFLDLIYIRFLWSGTNDDVLMRPERLSAHLAVFWLVMIPLCFLFAQTVDFSGKIGSSGFLDYWLFSIK